MATTFLAEDFEMYKQIDEPVERQREIYTALLLGRLKVDSAYGQPGISSFVEGRKNYTLRFATTSYGKIKRGLFDAIDLHVDDFLPKEQLHDFLLRKTVYQLEHETLARWERYNSWLRDEGVAVFDCEVDGRLNPESPGYFAQKIQDRLSAEFALADANGQATNPDILAELAFSEIKNTTLVQTSMEELALRTTISPIPSLATGTALQTP